MRRPLVDLSSLVLVHITLVVYINSLIGIHRHNHLTNIRVDSVLFISANIFIGSELDVVKYLFLFLALVAFFVQWSGTICENLLASI